MNRYKLAISNSFAMLLLQLILKDKSKQEKVASVPRVIEEVRNLFNACANEEKWEMSEIEMYINLGL